MFEKNKIFKSKNNLNNLYKFQKLVRQYPFASDMPAAAIHKRKGRFARRFRKPPKIANLIKKIEMDKIYLSFVFFRATRMTFANSKSSPFNACCSKIASQFFARRWRRRGKIHCRILNKRKMLFKFLAFIPGTQPFGPKTLLWLVQTVHFCPWTPGLQTHLPVICSQSSRTEPNVEQPQASITFIKFTFFS